MRRAISPRPYRGSVTDPSRPVDVTSASATAPAKPLSTGVVVALVLLALAPAGTVVAILATRPKAPPIRACETYIRTKVLQPATFKWSGETWSERRAEVTGTLDARITSGGLLRITFRCSMAKNAGGDWIVSAGFVND